MNKSTEEQVTEIMRKAEKDAEHVREVAKKKVEQKLKRDAEKTLWEEVRAALEFRLAEENDLLGHPKREQLWNLANELGSSYDTEYYYDTLAELLKP